MKRLIALGDSITKGTYTAPGDPSPNTVADPNYAELVRGGLGYDELLNYAMNGISVSTATPTLPEHSMCRRIDCMQTGDTVIIAGGTNDYAAGVPLGCVGDREESTFYGALEVLFGKVRSKYDASDVYVVTPIRRQLDGENSRGHTFEEYRVAVAQVAEAYGFNVIDGFGVPIDPKTEEGRRAHILDGLHPNVEGHRLYAEYLISKMKK